MVLQGADGHRKFHRMARSLEISPFEALGLTVSLWLWFDANFPYGELPSEYDALDVALSIRCAEICDPDALMKAWIDSGLIDETGAGYSIHNWMKEGRTGFSADRRVAAATKAAHVRWHKDVPSANCELCVEAMPSDAQALPTQSPPMPSMSTSMSSSASPKEEDIEDASTKKVLRYRDDDPERPF